LKTFLEHDKAKIAEMRDRLRAEDHERQRQAKQRKAAEAQRKEDAELKRLEAERLRTLALEIKRTWNLDEFGQGCEKSLTNKHKDNIREALTRLRTMSANLPDDLRAQWPYFLEFAPAYYFRKWGAAIGRGLVNELQDLMRRLEKNPQCLAAYMRDVLRKHRGELTL